MKTTIDRKIPSMGSIPPGALTQGPGPQQDQCAKEPAQCNTSSVAPDQWVHRSAGMRCRTCMWFVPKHGTQPLRADQDDLGRCRRHAPAMNGWPVMFESDYCGDHKLDENKRR
jgi:hypothetical protein